MRASPMRGVRLGFLGAMIGAGATWQCYAAASGVCAECHAEIAARYSVTPMARSSGSTAIGRELPPVAKSSFTDRQSAFVYKVGRDLLGYRIEFRRREEPEGASEVRRVPYFIGSGSAAMSFLISVDGFLYESPATWYAQGRGWDLSPGYESYSYPFLTRAAVPGCLRCHASGVQAVAGTQNGYASPPFTEGGVACERCHGPGDLHVAKMRQKEAGAPATGVVNPAKLDAERRDSICAQCHLAGEVIVEKAGQSGRGFQAGDKLEEHRVAFARTRNRSAARVVSHVENLAQSKCKQESGDNLWCGTCHDAHSMPAPERQAEWFRSKCLTCHAVSQCGEAADLRLAAQDNCVSCHMPKNPVSDAQHVAYTNHAIPRRPGKPGAIADATDDLLVTIGGLPAAARELGLAYAILAARLGNPADSERAFPLLQKAQAAAPDDPQVLSYLADLYKKRGNDAMAIRLYERLLGVDPSEPSARVALGAYALERGDSATAIRLWSEVLEKSPALLLVRVNLAVALVRAKEPEKARRVLKKALEFNPYFRAARELLAQIPSKPLIP
jgi:hypothetical protein